MQIRVDTNVKQFTKKLGFFEKDLMKSATPRAINKTLEKAQGHQLLLTKKFLDRPTRQTQKGFFVKFASKRNPIGSLNMKDFVEEYLQYQIEGGFRYSDKKNPVPIQGNARLNQFGNITGKRRGLIKNKNQFIAEIKGITAVWERVAVRRGHSGGVKPIILLTQNFANYEKKYPFFKETKKLIDRTFNKQLKVAFARAKRKVGL